MASEQPPDWTEAPAYVWDGCTARPVSLITAPPLDLLRGIDSQKSRAVENIVRHEKGFAAHDMLLWGSRGMGKSALIRAAVAQADPEKLGLVQLSASDLDSMPQLFGMLREVDRRFLLFVDDLGFTQGDMAGPRRLRSLLEGGVEARPANLRLVVTTNHRSIVPREMEPTHAPRHERDTADDELALADRFGLVLGFHACDQATYLEIVDAYAVHFDLEYDAAEALAWSRQRGARSGRVAWQFIVECAGRAGRAI